MTRALTVPPATALVAPGWKDKADAFLAELAAELAPERDAWATLATSAVAPVTDDATRAGAIACIRTAREASDALEARRKAFTGPLHEVKTKIDRLFKPAVSAAEQLERSYRDRVNAYDTRVEDERRAAARAAAEAARTAAPVALVVPPPPAEVAGVTARRVWRYRVVDPALVPRELCSPDDAKIKARGPGETPGIEWFEESTVTVR
jgi:hypothetical protein